MEILMNRSYTCRQRLRYDCKRSRLLNTPSPENSEFRPVSWWVFRQNLRMDYWAGAFAVSRKCECGIGGTCVDRSKWCNCDAILDTWQAYEGEILDKDVLIVFSCVLETMGIPWTRKKVCFKFLFLQFYLLFSFFI